MKLGPLNHVGFVTPSAERSANFYRETMGATTIRDPIYLIDGSIRIVFVETPNVLIELIEPLVEDSGVSDFLRAHPDGGQHHLCYEVADIHEAWAWYEKQGAVFACPIVTGVLGLPIFFIDASALGGSLIEIIETPRMKAEAAQPA